MNLSNTRVTSLALRSLGGLVALQSLALYGCKGIEDAESIDALQRGLPSLRCLRLNSTSDDDGILGAPPPEEEGEDDDDDEEIRALIGGDLNEAADDDSLASSNGSEEEDEEDVEGNMLHFESGEEEGETDENDSVTFDEMDVAYEDANDDMSLQSNEQN